MADFDFARFGIGGISSKFNEVFGNTFESRILPEMGNTDHTKGILIRGPQGCGKSFLAKQMAKVLTPHPTLCLNCVKLLQNPKMLQYKVNKIFEPAELEQNDKGDNSLLHVLILEDVDALMKQTTPENNELKVISNYIWDKVDKLNNVLLIGLTKYKDIVDPDLISPYRFNLVIQVTKPCEEDRLKILKGILLQEINPSTLIAVEIDLKLEELASITKNFTAAELEGLLRSAVAFAHMRESDLELAEVRWVDIETALAQII